MSKKAISVRKQHFSNIYPPPPRMPNSFQNKQKNEHMYRRQNATENAIDVTNCKKVLKYIVYVFIENMRLSLLIHLVPSISTPII